MELVADLCSLSSNLLQSIDRSHQISENLNGQEVDDDSRMGVSLSDGGGYVRRWLAQSKFGTELERAARTLDAATIFLCPRTHIWIRNNYKWLFAQCMMMVANVVQSELVRLVLDCANSSHLCFVLQGRRQAKYLCDKRLAEVPEFPLL